MKKASVLSLLLACLLMAGLLSACGGGSDQASEPEEEGESIATAETDAEPMQTTAAGNGSILIVYFAVAENSDVDAMSSASVVPGTDRGMSGFIADIIAERTGGELFSIRTEEQYPGVYDDLANRAKEQQDKGELPVLTSHIENLDDYDVIFIGYPIWWYTLPQVMFSFFDEYDFSGKTIIPFCTHLGSRDGGTFAKIKELEPGTMIEEGFAVNQDDVADCEPDLLTWLEGLGY